MPTTARSLASTTVSHPAARILSPPTPKNSSGSGNCERRASINCAPYISPEASPAEIRTRTEHCNGVRQHGGAPSLSLKPRSPLMATAAGLLYLYIVDLKLELAGPHRFQK